MLDTDAPHYPGVSIAYSGGKLVAYMRVAQDALRRAQALSNRITVPTLLGSIMQTGHVVEEIIEGLEGPSDDDKN